MSRMTESQFQIRNRIWNTYYRFFRAGLEVSKLGLYEGKQPADSLKEITRQATVEIEKFAPKLANVLHGAIERGVVDFESLMLIVDRYHEAERKLNDPKLQGPK